MPVPPMWKRHAVLHLEESVSKGLSSTAVAELTSTAIQVQAPLQTGGFQDES